MFARVRERKEKHIAAERLSAYLDGQVTAQERIQVQQHLGACAACAHELDTLRYTIDLLRATPRLSVPRAFTLSETDVGRATVRRQMPRLALYLQGATALVAALLLVVIVGDVVRKPVRYAAPQQVVMERAVRETVVVEAAQEAGLEIREEAAVAEKEVEVEKPLEVQKAVAVTVEVEREAVMERPAAAPATAAAAIAEAEGEPDAEVPAELPMRAMAVVTEETPPPPLEAQPKADVQALAAEPTIEALMAQETVEEAAPAAEIVLVILLVILLGLTLWLRRRR